MYVYLFVILLSAVGSRAIKKQNSKKVLYFMLFLGFFLCTGYTCGSDWREYEMVYEECDDEFPWLRLAVMEPFYLFLTFTLNHLGIGFWPFFIVTKLVLFWKIVSMIKRFCNDSYILFAFTFYLGFWGINHFIDPPFRNMIAAFFFMCSIDSILEKNFKKYCIWIFIATMFHYSTILFLPAYFFFTRQFSNKVLIWTFVGINILFISPERIFSVIASLFDFIPYVQGKVGFYGTESDNVYGTGKVISVAYLMHCIIFFLLLKYRKYISNSKEGLLLFQFSIFFVFIFRIGLSAVIFSRIQLFVACFYCITIANILYVMRKKYKKTFMFFIYLMSILAVYKTSQRPIMDPYTNYFLEYNSGMTFDQRSDYNFKYSKFKIKEND